MVASVAGSNLAMTGGVSRPALSVVGELATRGRMNGSFSSGVKPTRRREGAFASKGGALPWRSHCINLRHGAMTECS